MRALIATLLDLAQGPFADTNAAFICGDRARRAGDHGIVRGRAEAHAGLVERFAAEELPSPVALGLFQVPSRALPIVLDRLHATLNPGGVLLASNWRGQDDEGVVDGRYTGLIKN